MEFGNDIVEAVANQLLIELLNLSI